MSNKSVVVNTLASCAENPGSYPSHLVGTASAWGKTEYHGTVGLGLRKVHVDKQLRPPQKKGETCRNLLSY